MEGNILIAQKMGLPRLLQQSLVVSDKDVELAKKCLSYLIQEMKKFTENTMNRNPVWIPFSQVLAEILPSEKGTDNRFTKRLFSFLTIITLSRAHLRSRLEYGEESLVIANLEYDLYEVLDITQNLHGIPPYKLKFFKEFFLPLYKRKQTPDTNVDDNGKQERIIAVTTRELCELYKEETGKTITTNNLKQNYLNEFVNNGLIDEEDSVLDRRQKIYYPLIDLPSVGDDGKKQEEGQTDEIKKLSISDRLDNILQ